MRSFTFLSRARSLFLLTIAVLFYACGSKKADEPEPNPITNTDLFAVTEVLPGADITGGLITIKGNKFGTDTSAIRIKFGDSKVTSPLTVTNTEITVHVPTYAVAGKIEIIKGTSTVSSPANFSILPDNNNYAEYDRVTFTGTDRLPQDHFIIAAASAGDIIAFAGYETRGSIRVKVIDFYNVITRRWKTINKNFDDNICAAAAGNKICFAGSSNVDIYDVKSDDWTNAKLSTPRWRLTAAGGGNKIVFAGGMKDPNFFSYSDLIDIYDASTNTWSTAKLSRARINMASATARGKIFLAGGTGGLGTEVDIYDTNTNQWTTSNMATNRSEFSSAGAGDLIVFSGNKNYLHQYMDIYDISINKWQLTYVPSDHYGEFSASAGTKVLISLSSKAVRAFDVKTETYETLPASAEWRAAAGIKNKIIFATNTGGFDIYTLSR